MERTKVSICLLLVLFASVLCSIPSIIQTGKLIKSAYPKIQQQIQAAPTSLTLSQCSNIVKKAIVEENMRTKGGSLSIDNMIVNSVCKDFIKKMKKNSTTPKPKQ